MKQYFKAVNKCNVLKTSSMYRKSLKENEKNNFISRLFSLVSNRHD